MTKQELLRALTECVKTEEMAIPIYSRHVNNALFFADFKAEDKAAIMKVLYDLRVESQRHQRMLTKLIERIQESDTDVY